VMILAVVISFFTTLLLGFEDIPVDEKPVGEEPVEGQQKNANPNPFAAAPNAAKN